MHPPFANAKRRNLGCSTPPVDEAVLFKMSRSGQLPALHATAVAKSGRASHHTRCMCTTSGMLRQCLRACKKFTMDVIACHILPRYSSIAPPDLQTPDRSSRTASAICTISSSRSYALTACHCKWRSSCQRQKHVWNRHEIRYTGIGMKSVIQAIYS